MREGRYLYCIVPEREQMSLESIGLGGKKTYTIPYEDLAAVVHRCPAQPYASQEHEMAIAWVTAHQEVVEAAWRRWHPILPLSFNNIIVGDTEKEAEQKVRGWLEHEYERLKRKMEKMTGKDEFGVQVFWHPRAIAQSLSQSSPELRQMAEEIKAAPRGRAYLLRQRLGTLLKEQMEAWASQCCQDIYSNIRQHIDDIFWEKTKKSEEDMKMLLSLSCLVSRGKEKGLGEELETISRREGFSVRFTGPWPPYSFVGNP
ncbi:MAG: GvpL/GvpF family gas vesicle protein [Chloroflexi bacterium]|nr:GvpL/GvpF family gas vesicle protein [Chloroflexota bacterium]